MIDVRIFGVPERIDNIHKTQNKLGVPTENIFIDEDHKGLLWNARRAWSKETDASHVLVLQDDIEICNDFLKYCNIITEVHPDEIISLFPWQFATRQLIRQLPTRSPYCTTKWCLGQGVIMRADYVKPCLDSWSDKNRADDTNITVWAEKNDIRILTTLPSIIQHIGDVSVFDITRVIGETEFFEEYPVNVNWENPFVTPWTNIVRR